MKKIYNTLYTNKKIPDKSKNQKNITNTNTIITQIYQNNKPHTILYQRNINKKNRPSHKKRNKKKNNKHSKSNNIKQNQKKKFKNNTSSKSNTYTITFIIKNSNPHSSLNNENNFSFNNNKNSSNSINNNINFIYHFTKRLLINSTPLLINIIYSTKSNPINQTINTANRK